MDIVPSASLVNLIELLIKLVDRSYFVVVVNSKIESLRGQIIIVYYGLPLTEAKRAHF